MAVTVENQCPNCGSTNTQGLGDGAAFCHECDWDSLAEIPESGVSRISDGDESPFNADPDWEDEVQEITRREGGRAMRQGSHSLLVNQVQIAGIRSFDCAVPFMEEMAELNLEVIGHENLELFKVGETVELRMTADGRTLGGRFFVKCVSTYEEAEDYSPLIAEDYSPLIDGSILANRIVFRYEVVLIGQVSHSHF